MKNQNLQRNYLYCFIIMLFMACLLSACTSPVAQSDSLPPHVAIIPLPFEIKTVAGSFTIDENTSVFVNRPEAIPAANYLSTLITPASDFTLKPYEVGKGPSSKSIFLELTSSKQDKEGYSLSVTENQIHIIASSAHGLFYAMQTLRQLLPPAIEVKNKSNSAWTLPAISINDRPRFPWRGMMLDVSRHFFPVSAVKQFLDRMALYKFNTLHLHLTDDQGWRLQSKRFPVLTEQGAWREFNNQDSVCLQRAATDASFQLPAEMLQQVNGKTLYGGFYTTQDIQELIAYAAERYITIVPEIDMPGHMNAAITSFNYLTCDDQQGWGKLFTKPLCPCEESTYQFIEGILQEVSVQFPGPYIHIGADEVDESSWLNFPACQVLLKKQGGKSTRDLHRYFVNRVNGIVQRLGKKSIAWDEILDGNADSSIRVSYWRGWVPDAPQQAVQRGHDVIMGPNTYCYFDYTQDSKTLSNLYSFNPRAGILAKYLNQIVGVQGQVWTEGIPSMTRLDFMTMPRMSALAEVAWNNQSSFEDYMTRLPYHYQRWDEMNIAYRLPDIAVKQHLVFTDSLTLELTLPVGVKDIRYYVSGVDSTASRSYEGPLLFDESTTLHIESFGKNGRNGTPYTVRLEKQSYLLPVDERHLLPGIECRYYEGQYQSVKELIGRKPSRQIVMDSIGFPRSGLQSTFALSFNGYIDVPWEGIYTFYLSSDDGSALTIGERTVVIDDGYHAPREITGQIALQKGIHPFRLDYFDGGGGRTMLLQYEGPAIPRQPLPAHVLKYKKKDKK